MPRLDGHDEAVVFAAVRSRCWWFKSDGPLDTAMCRSDLGRVLIAEINCHVDQLTDHMNLRGKDLSENLQETEVQLVELGSA